MTLKASMVWTAPLEEYVCLLEAYARDDAVCDTLRGQKAITASGCSTRYRHR